MYELSTTLPKKGIQVIKYNYTNMKKKKIILKLSDDEKWLEYEPIDKTLKDFLKIKPKILISSLENFLYGGMTSTF